jgi:hypothetical protein
VSRSKRRDEESGPAISWLLLGLLSTITGGAIVLVAVGVIAMPAGGANAPPWVIGLAGSVFLVMGLYSTALAVLVWRDPELAERVVRGEALNLTSWLVGLFTVGVFFTLSAWIAWGPGPRSFTGGVGAGSVGVGGMVGESMGRAVFGVSAVVTGLVGVWMLSWGIRRLRRH